MALCTECDARIEYKGNRSQTDFTFPFEYDNTSEIYVSIWDEEQLTYVSSTDWSLVNPTTIRLAQATSSDLVIYRCTDLDQARAVFHPGHSIKAGDLNDNWKQLANAIEESKCAVGAVEGQIEEGWEYWLNRIDADDTYKGVPGDLVKSNSRLTIDDDHVATTKWIDNRYWDCCEETTYSTDRWADEMDDVHIPTTLAVEQRLADLQALEGVQKVTGVMQRNKQWDDTVTNDAHVATTDAIVERLDNYLADSNTKYPSSYWLQPGKIWIKSDTAELFYRRAEGTQWIQLDTKGDKGDPGQDSTVPGPGGPPGATPVFSVGNTITGDPGTDADVVQSGTTLNPVLTFTIPRGEKGEKGEDGDGAGEILTFLEPLIKDGTTVSLNLISLPNTP